MGALKGEMIVLDDPSSLAMAAAEFLAERRKAARGATFRMTLAGGSTPKLLYRLLGKMNGFDWPGIELFWGDERFVPHDHPDSNYRMVQETLLAHGAQPKAIHPIPTDGTPDEAAQRYERILQAAYGETEVHPEKPLFDLTLLGLGEDGHIASLLPGEPVLQERKAWVAAVPHGRAQPRITLTFPALEASEWIVFLVSGAVKAAALRKARSGDPSIPAGLLRPRGTIVWFADRAAAMG